MKRSLVVRRLAGALFVLFASAASAQNVGVTLKLMEFDVTQPARQEYRDVRAPDGIVDRAVDQAWSNLSGTALEPIRQWLSAPDRLGSGMTARDIVITLGAPGPMNLVPTAQHRGRLTMQIPGNRIELTSTHPVSRGKSMDPRMRVSFDMTLEIDFGTVEQAPHVRASEAVLKPGNVRVAPLNEWAAIGLGVDKLISDLGGAQSIVDRISGAFANARLTVTNSFNAQLASQKGLLRLPDGYTYNGGRVEPGRIVLAGYKAKEMKPTTVAVVASWPKSLGELMKDCAPVGIGATWQSGPKPFIGANPAPVARAQVQNVNPRVPRGDAFICSAVLRVPAGAPLTVTWSEPVRVSVGSPNPIVMRTVLAASPQGWNNPIVPNAPEYVLALAKENRPGVGVQLNAAAAARRANPIDPVATAKVRDPAAPVTRITDEKAAARPVTATTPAAAATTRTRAEAVQLNPQPLPPVSSPFANATRQAPTTATPATGATSVLRDRAVPTTGTAPAAPASSLSR